MENSKDKKELGAKELVPNSLAYDLAKSKQSKNLLSSIRKETRATRRVLDTWKIEDISRLQLKLDKDAEKFSKLKQTIGTRKKKQIPTEDRGPEEKKPEEKKPEEKKPEEKKPEEKKPSSEDAAKRRGDFEKERATRYRQLRERGVLPEEAKRRAYNDTVASQKYKPQVTTELPKPKPTGGFRLPELPKLKLPELNLPKPKLPKLPNFKLNPEQLSRQSGWNKLVGKIFDVKDVSDLGSSIARKDVGGALTSASGLLSNIPKLNKLAYAPAAEKLSRGDVVGAGLDALVTKASGRLISGATNILSRVPGLGRLPGFLGGVSSVANVPLAMYGALEVTGGAEMLRQQGRTASKTIKDIKTPVLREQAIRDLTEGKGNLQQINKNPSGTFGLPALSTGGIVTQPTLAIIGEGGEKEYIVPESKLQNFIGSKSSNNELLKKPARIILGVVHNFISQFGTSSGDIRRMIGGDILRLERIYGRERFVLPVFTRGEGSFDNIIGSAFKNLIKGKKSVGEVSQELYDAVGNLLDSFDAFMGEIQTISPSGDINLDMEDIPDVSSSSADLKLAAFLSTLESTGKQNGADVFQSILNRTAQNYSNYGPLIKQMTARAQFSPYSAVVYGDSGGDPYAQSKYARIASLLGGSPQERISKLQQIASQSDGLQQLQKLFEAGSASDAAFILNDFQQGGQLSQSSATFIGGRTDFGASPGIGGAQGGVVNRGPGGNYFGSTNANKPAAKISGVQTTQQPAGVGEKPNTSSQTTNVFKSENANNLTSSNLVTKFRASGNAYKSGLGIKEHEGVDFALSQGTPISFKQGGTILKTRLTSSSDKYANDGYGNVIDVKLNDGKILRLAHLSKVEPWVSVGQKFETNEIVFYSGGEKGAPGSGMSDGPHLHLEQHSKPLDYKISLEGKIDPIRNGGASQILIGGNPRKARQAQVTPQQQSQNTISNLTNLQKNQTYSGQRYKIENPSGRQVKNYNDVGPHHDYQTTNRSGQTLAVKDVNLLIGNSTDVPVPSPVNGTVTVAGYIDGFGPNTVYLKDNSGNLVIIGHMKSKNVRVGQTVTVGQPLGIQGSEGQSTGPHVHIEAKSEIIASWINGMVSGQYTGSSVSPSSSILPGTSSAASQRIGQVRQNYQTQVANLRRRLPGLSGKSRFRRISSLPQSSQSNSLVAVQPVVIPQQPSQQQNIINQVYGIQPQQISARPTNTTWTPIVQYT